MSGLTKQHFKEFAEIIKKLSYKSQIREDENINFIESDIIETDKLLNDLCRYFKTQNPLFNENRFKKACLE